MNWTVMFTLLVALAADDPEAARAERERLMKLHLGDALEYTIYRDASQHEKLDFRKEPVYVWTNPVRTSQQDGVVFIWTGRGRPEAIGTIFSSPTAGGLRSVHHELHSLSLSTLGVTRAGTHEHQWTPKVPGIELVPVEGARPPARSAAERLGQMRAMAREFSAVTRDALGSRWELRLLPQPLYRYESTDAEVRDGALFAFVTSAGTDPEAILLIEARQRPTGPSPLWCRGLARLTDLELSVRHKGTEVFSATSTRGDTLKMYPNQEYRLIGDRIIPDRSVPSRGGANE
jgi:hypothetical protein